MSALRKDAVLDHVKCRLLESARPIVRRLNSICSVDEMTTCIATRSFGDERNVKGKHIRHFQTNHLVRVNDIHSTRFGTRHECDGQKEEHTTVCTFASSQALVS